MRTIDRLIFDEYKSCASGLQVYRVLFGLYILLTKVPAYAWISRFPDEFFRPPNGLALLFSGFPPGWFFEAIHFGLIISSLCLIFGKHVRFSSVMIGSLILLGNIWAYSFGKINHDILLIVVSVVMAFSDWGGTRMRRGTVEERGWPMSLLALLIALALLTAALAKILTGWLDPFAPATLGHLLRNHYVTERHTILSGILVEIGNLGFWKFVDYTTILIEAAFLLAIGSLRQFRLVCALACFFHLGVWLIMDIAFAYNVIAYGAFVDWSKLARWEPFVLAWERFDILSNRMRLGHLVAIGVGLFFLCRTLGNPWVPLVSTGVLVVGCGISSGYLMHRARRALRLA